MNILFYYNSTINPNTGGISRVSHVLSESFKKRGYNVYFLSMKRDSNITIPNQLFLPEDSYISEKNISFVKELFIKKKIDIVINQSAMNNAASEMLFVSNEKNVPIISVIHNTLFGHIKNIKYSRKGYYSRFLISILSKKVFNNILLYFYKLRYRQHYKCLYKHSAKIVMLSASFKKEMISFLGKDIDNKIISISNPNSFNIVFENDTKENEVLYVGAVDFTQKRVDILLEIWSKIWMNHTNWKLTVVGGGESLNEAKILCNNMGLGNITFEGFKNPIEYYKKASIFCMTSSYEGFGIVLIEAMNFGVVPLAFSSYDSIYDIIDDEVNGFLIQPFDINQYVQKLDMLMKNSELRRKVSIESIKKSKEFSIKKITDKWVNLFEEVTKNLE